MNEYRVIKYTGGDFTVCVPGSKSITNRALTLAALSSGRCDLSGVLFSDDTRAFLSCLDHLGFEFSADEEKKTVSVLGTGGIIPKKSAEINVRSAGTAARFMTVLLAFAGGEYVVRSSPQMEKRPMQPLIGELEKAGVSFEFSGKEGHFPFILRSDGIFVREIAVDTQVRSQFASALLLSASLTKNGLFIVPTGNRTAGSYIRNTETMLSEFGVAFEKRDGKYFIPPQKYSRSSYRIEPDFSAADYFFAAGALLGVKAKVKGLSLSSMQGDKKFLGVLEQAGARVRQEEDGLVVEGTGRLSGVNVDMNDFSDQALTLAAIAPFASSPTTIEGIGHIRAQECDRIHAIVHNLTKMGVKTQERADGVTIFPCEKIEAASIDTFDDHRVAMAFAVAGLKCGNLTIKNPLCTSKTFENFFEVLEGMGKSE